MEIRAVVEALQSLRGVAKMTPVTIVRKPRPSRCSSSKWMDGSAYCRNLAERHTAHCETVEFFRSSRSSERVPEPFFLLIKLIMDGRVVGYGEIG
jgi:hypothetical protein